MPSNNIFIVGKYSVQNVLMIRQMQKSFTKIYLLVRGYAVFFGLTENIMSQVRPSVRGLLFIIR